MFSTKEFIEVSRKFVCVRLESFENQQYHDMVREFLDGRFANTAFGILAPDGETRLSGTGRGPEQALGGRGPRGGGEESNEAVIAKLESIAASYRPGGTSEQMVPQDFHSFRQALNVASADQRLLVYAVAPKGKEDALRAKLAPVFAHEDVIGIFHLDFAEEATDREWNEVVEDASSRPGLYLVRSGQFGQKGEVLESIPLSADEDIIRGTLLASNLAFSLVEERKDYATHVQAGRREGIFFENEMPYGEDRDGDGVIDHGGEAGFGGKRPERAPRNR